MHSFDHLKSTYFQECAELLDSVYVNLATLEEASDSEAVHAIFRAVHSIKGGGGAFGYDRMVAFAHGLETLLDLLRDERIGFGPEIASLLLRATDALSDLVGAERTGDAVAQGFEDELAAELTRAASQASAAPLQQPTPAAPRPTPAEPAVWRIGFSPHASMFRNANEPLLLIRALQRLGQVTVTADLSRLPGLERMDPEAAYLAWTIDIATDAPAARLFDVFEFVSDHCDLVIEERRSLPDPVEPAAPAPPERTAAEAPPRRVELPAASHSVRVDVEKVDRLVNLVGELVINQAMLVQLGGLLPSDMCPGLITGLETLSQHLRELQEGVMAIRTQPVRSVFSRMPRLVRELSAQLGKDVRLVVTGEGTEIDKTVIEQLADPLTHLLRNALDHGIESPAARVARDKPPQGTIHLAAEHRSGRIIIEVSDDGQGIDRERVLARARQRGLVADGATPSEEEIDNLIFLPAFSTAEVVSNISGRGVGMDVVKRNVQSLGGRINVQSRFGEGSRFTLSLPLTLAVLDGMVVSVARETFIIPLTAIIESLRPKASDIHPVVGRGDVLALRGEYVPLIPLYRCFSISGAIKDPCRGIVIIVQSEHAGRIGVMVDDLLGQQQVVVKSLESNYGSVDGVSGATILGNGRVALILDIERLRVAADHPSSPPLVGTGEVADIVSTVSRKETTYAA